MLYRDVIDLVDATTVVNDLGDYVETETTSRVFANKKSIRQSEFYQAMANGLQPELMFEMKVIDYNNQDKLYFNNKKYNIIRAYNRNGEDIELVCEGIVGTEKRVDTVEYLILRNVDGEILRTVDGKILRVRSE